MISAVIGVPLLLWITWLGGWYLAVLIGVLSLLALKEYLEIGEKAGLISNKKGILLFFLVWIGVFYSGYEISIITLVLFWFLFTFGKFAVSYPEISLQEASYGFMASIYPLTFLSLLYLLRNQPDGLIWCFYVFFLVWITDSGAYFTGMMIGKRKLAPRVSPNKSVEGALGGLVASLVLGIVFWVITAKASLVFFLLISLVGSIASQIGDLFESALKRSAGIKDSGNIIPGHGGVLDRFDSFMFAIPVVYFAVTMGLMR